MTLIRRGLLSDVFSRVAVKQLKQVEVNPTTSNQHEYNGDKALRRLFGNDDRRDIPARFIWLGNEQEGVSADGFISWYDSRRNKPPRMEYRLYYNTNAVTALMQEGDTLFVALRRDGTALVIIALAASTVQNQLLWLSRETMSVLYPRSLQCRQQTGRDIPQAPHGREPAHHAEPEHEAVKSRADHRASPRISSR